MFSLLEGQPDSKFLSSNDTRNVSDQMQLSLGGSAKIAESGMFAATVQWHSRQCCKQSRRSQWGWLLQEKEGTVGTEGEVAGLIVDVVDLLMLKGQGAASRTEAHVTAASVMAQGAGVLHVEGLLLAAGVVGVDHKAELFGLTVLSNHMRMQHL